jgi:ribosomal protein S27E
VKLRCPDCKHHLGHLEVLKFFRLRAISCPQCGELLVIDGRGRAAIMITPLAALVVGVLFLATTGLDKAPAVAVIAGFILSPIMGARFGRLGVWRGGEPRRR